MIIMTECARKTSSTVSSNAIERSVKLENENLALHDQVMKMLKALSMAKKRMEKMVELENENAALRRELDATKRMSSLATVEMVLRSAALQKENEVLRKRMVEMETLFGKGGGHASPHRSRSVSPASETLLIATTGREPPGKTLALTDRLSSTEMEALFARWPRSLPSYETAQANE